MSGAKALAQALDPTGDKEYDALDDGIRLGMTHKEWSWLSDAEKANLTQTEGEPESFTDGV